MNEVESITREIAALDERFNSPENVKSGKLKLPEYLVLGQTLREKLAVAERRAAQTRAAPKPRAGNDAPVSVGFLDSVLQEIAPRVGKEISDRIEHALLPIFSRLTTAERRVRELEIAIPKYCGTYIAAKHYPKHSIVTDHGSMWVARQGTDTRPPGDHWQLCVKGGR